MNEAEIIKLQYEAIKKYSNGEKQLAYKVIQQLSPYLRDYIDRHHPREVSVEELIFVISEKTKDWEKAQAASN